MSTKALLLIDNAPSHATETQLMSDDANITTMFLLIALLPSNQWLTKLYYSKSLLVHVSSIEESEISNSKNMNLKAALFLLPTSWAKITPHAIQKCWHKIFSYTIMCDILTVILKIWFYCLRLIKDVNHSMIIIVKLPKLKICCRMLLLRLTNWRNQIGICE